MSKETARGILINDQFKHFLVESIKNDEKTVTAWLKHIHVTIRNLYDSQWTVLPGSMKKLNCLAETIYLLFKLSYYCPSFKRTFATNKDTMDLNYMLVYYLVDIYNSGMRTGLFEILIALILELSSDPEYCKSLN